MHGFRFPVKPGMTTGARKVEEKAGMRIPGALNIITLKNLNHSVPDTESRRQGGWIPTFAWF
jgi:hypothetical protein